ncbi:tetratricopeptide repeat protein 27 [Galendromus occidentalis]|uniref:Tetratricopeptide repeat protein 27 n=1 Tax=Galendromus occidentalis TaxID=34638 RepID=A0AAJ6QUP1_9ACAR|nr:tetratricopeptide repeat protein 27 [Galendromus occidentalis]
MTVSCEELMLLLLHDDSRASDNPDFNTIVSLLKAGNFRELFEHPWFRKFGAISFKSTESVSEFLDNDVCGGDGSDGLELLTAGVVFLSYFFRRNFIGPPDDGSTDSVAIGDQGKDSRLLDIDGEQAYHLVTVPWALFAARKILIEKAEELKSFRTLKVWQQRYAMTHQQLISERVQSLQRIVAECTAGLDDDSLIEHTELWCQFHLESAVANVEFFNEARAADILRNVSKRLGFNVKLDGALGTRTRFQQKSVAQLTLTVERAPGEVCIEHEDVQNKDQLPKDVTLQDETVLHQIKFDQEQENSRLNCIEQTIVLGISMLRKCLSGAEELREEEVVAHYSRLVTDPQIWGIQFSALYQRSRIEIQKSRKVERALSQFQLLLDCVRSDKMPFSERSRMAFACRIPPIWKLERDLAQGLLSLGLTKSALELFLRLQMWEEVVGCYQSTMRSDRAEALIRQLLNEQETPLLHCLLGEITGDTDELERAWSLSGGSYARAKRSLGGYHYQKQEYQTAIDHFRQALELNRLQCTTWHRIAFCYMKTERYAECVSAYKEAVNLNPDNFEAWNNMAKAYISLNEREKAWRVLQEALKCNYDDWRIWENYVLVSMDVKAFNEVIKGWHRLLDLKHNFADGRLANLLVKVIADNIKDVDGNQTASYLRKKLYELFGRITATLSASDEIWSAYGDLHFHSEPAEGTSWSEHVQKIVQCYQKAIRFTMQSKSWEKNSENASNILLLLERSWSVVDHFSEKISPEQKERIRASLEMTSKNAVSLISRSLEYHNEAVREKFEKSMENIKTHH